MANETTIPKPGGALKEDPKVDQYISNGMKLIHSEKTRDNIVEQLKADPDPSSAVASTTVNILEQMDRSAESAGVKIPNEVRIAGASPIMEQVIEVGQASGALTLSEDQTKEAASMTVSLYLKTAMENGTITMGDLQAMNDIIQQKSAMEEKEGGGTTPPQSGVLSPPQGGGSNVR